jgi:hypothetical protein
MSRRAALLLSCLLAGAPGAQAEDPHTAAPDEGSASHATADEPAPEMPAPSPAEARLAARMRALEGKSLADPHAKAALEQGRRALDQAGAARRKGDAEASTRAERLADAALTLAERLNALAEERALARATSERTRLTRAQTQAAQAALAKERARLQELSQGAQP